MEHSPLVADIYIPLHAIHEWDVDVVKYLTAQTPDEIKARESEFKYKKAQQELEKDSETVSNVDNTKV